MAPRRRIVFGPAPITSIPLVINTAAAFDVYLRRKLIDTVFYPSRDTVDEVKRSLVNHDDYDPDIVVRRRRR